MKFQNAGSFRLWLQEVYLGITDKVHKATWEEAGPDCITQKTYNHNPRHLYH